MVRWYDYVIAWMAAEVMLTAFFSLPIIGAIIAYMMYEYGWNSYCQFRLHQENR